MRALYPPTVWTQNRQLAMYTGNVVYNDTPTQVSRTTQTTPGNFVFGTSPNLSVSGLYGWGMTTCYASDQLTTLFTNAPGTSSSGLGNNLAYGQNIGPPGITANQQNMYVTRTNVHSEITNTTGTSVFVDCWVVRCKRPTGLSFALSTAGVNYGWPTGTGATNQYNSGGGDPLACHAKEMFATGTFATPQLDLFDTATAYPPGGYGESLFYRWSRPRRFSLAHGETKNMRFAIPGFRVNGRDVSEYYALFGGTTLATPLVALPRVTTFIVYRFRPVVGIASVATGTSYSTAPAAGSIAVLETHRFRTFWDFNRLKPWAKGFAVVTPQVSGQSWVANMFGLGTKTQPDQAFGR